MDTSLEAIDLFETLVSEYAGSKYAVAVDSCSSGLFLSMKYIKDVVGTSVTTVKCPKMTYVSVPAMIVNAGFDVEFTDEEWSGIYKLSPLPVIDGAARFTRDMYVKGHFQCLSFHSRKILSTGKGGMILADDKEAVDWLKQARFVGRNTDRYMDMVDVTVLGWNMNMTPEIAMRGIERFYGLSDNNEDCGSSNGRLDLSKFTVFKK